MPGAKKNELSIRWICYMILYSGALIYYMIYDIRVRDILYHILYVGKYVQFDVLYGVSGMYYLIYCMVGQ